MFVLGLLFVVGVIALLFVLPAMRGDATHARSPLLPKAPPRTVFDERVELKEGAAQGYGFTLSQPMTIDVSLTASPKPVNVMLMSEDQWLAYEQVHGQLFGGKYYYKQDLSKQNVMKWEAHDLLPAGKWRIVLERPQEAILFGKSSVVDVKITAQQ